MQIKIHTLPPLAAACFGGLLALCLSLFLTLSAHNKIQQQFLSHYGNALSQMAAKQAVDAAFNHDLVRLQVILQDVIANPNTVLATIHDVENNLLVQAGESRFGTPEGERFTSPIVLHDSIAGYVSVTLETQSTSLGSQTTVLGLIAGLLAVLLMWDMLRQKAIEFSPSKKADKPSAKDEALEDHQVNLDSDEHLPSVFSVVHIKNLDVLRQQLNGQNFRETIARLEKIMSDVMALYGGKKFVLVDNYYILTFKATDSFGEALFRSACSAYLILELASIIDKIPLDLAALVSAQENDVTPEKLPFAGLIVEASAAQDELINRRANFMDLGKNDGRKVIAGFKQPFQNLLEGQTKQLLQIF